MKKIVHVVAAIIKNEKNEVLCALRGPNMTLRDYWEFPGGKIEKDETKEQALIREIEEELSCQIKVLHLVEDTTYEYEKVIVRLETFMSEIISGIPLASEHAELRWVKVEDLHSLEWAPADIPAVNKLIK